MSTRLVLKVRRQSSALRAPITRAWRRENRLRISVRTRSRGAYARTHGAGGVVASAGDPMASAVECGLGYPFLRAFEHLPGVRIRDHPGRVLERDPLTLRNTLRLLRTRPIAGRLHQIEMTNLVNEAAAKSEVPVDRFDDAA